MDYQDIQGQVIIGLSIRLEQILLDWNNYNSHISIDQIQKSRALKPDLIISPAGLLVWKIRMIFPRGGILFLIRSREVKLNGSPNRLEGRGGAGLFEATSFVVQTLAVLVVDQSVHQLLVLVLVHEILQGSRQYMCDIVIINIRILAKHRSLFRNLTGLFRVPFPNGLGVRLFHPHVHCCDAALTP